MLHLIPKNIPPLADMLADLGNPHPCALADRLGVDERTARRWQKAGSAPRPVLLALFWLTQWGQSFIDVELTNRAAILTQMTQAQGRELSRLRNSLATLKTTLAVTRGRSVLLAHGSIPLKVGFYERFQAGDPAFGAEQQSQKRPGRDGKQAGQLPQVRHHHLPPSRLRMPPTAHSAAPQAPGFA